MSLIISSLINIFVLSLFSSNNKYIHSHIIHIYFVRS